MNQPQTPDNEVVNLSPPQEWLYKCDCPKCISGAHFDKDIAESYRKRGELTNEVARLQRIIEWAADLVSETRPATAKIIRDEIYRPNHFKLSPAPEEPTCKHETPNLMLLGSHWHWCSRCGAAQRLVDGKPFGNWQVPDKDAPAPEEPDLKEDIREYANHTLPYETICPEPATEWRELGPDEVICEGDEVKWKGGAWGKAQSSIGYKAGYWKGNKVARSRRFRTRRQLPKQEELPDSCCYCSDCNIPMKLHPEGTLSCPNYKNHEKLKQEEMPLESDLQKMEAIAEGSWGYEAKGFGLMTSHAIRYLRDEIQKLKEAK